MIVFVTDINADKLIKVHYDVSEINCTSTEYILRTTSVSGNNTIYVKRDKYYIKVV